MNTYFRITAYHPGLDISFIIASLSKVNFICVLPLVYFFHFINISYNILNLNKFNNNNNKYVDIVDKYYKVLFYNNLSCL